MNRVYSSWKDYAAVSGETGVAHAGIRRRRGGHD